MKKMLFSLLNLLLFSTLFGQPAMLDRNKVMDDFQGQQFEDAIEYLLPLAASDSGNVQVLGYLGYAYSMIDNTKAATGWYEKILQIDSLNISANQNLANMYSNRNPQIAAVLTQRLIRLQPGKAQHYREMGILLERAKKKDSALIFYQQAYALSPRDPRNAAALAEVLIDLKAYSRADSIVTAGLSIDSLDVPLLSLHVRSMYENGKYSSTLDAGEKLMGLNEVTVKPLMQVILSYYSLKRYTDCIRIGDYLQRQLIQSEALDYYEAKAWAGLRDFNRSNDLLRSCLQSAMSKTAETYYYALADNYEEMGKYSRAVAHYDTAYYLFRDPLAKYNVGRIYETKLKNLSVAKKNYRTFLLFADTSTPDKKKVYHYVSRWYGNNK